MIVIDAVIAFILGGAVWVGGIVGFFRIDQGHWPWQDRNNKNKKPPRLYRRTRRRMAKTRLATYRAKLALAELYEHKSRVRTEDRQKWRNDYEAVLRPLYPPPRLDQHNYRWAYTPGA